MMVRKEEQMPEETKTDPHAECGMNTANEHILQTQLENYAAGGLYPFHMPGHKRRMQPAPGLPASWDMTEVPGVDDLHDARGILREAMDRSADVWGADRTWYLVNGSTCGLLAGIRALAGRGSEVLCARNCHKAVFHALELAGFRVRWILPPIDPVWGICGSIRAGQVEAAIRRHPGIRALILTSPTYEGVLSDIEGICRVCHDRKIPVLVDEAHGAHLTEASHRAGFPKGALACGADVVIQSPHKTLPSLTQTALLHLQGSLGDPERIEDELDIFETSSPSYPLMASLDECTGILRARGEALVEEGACRIGRFDTAVRNLQKIRILFHTPDIEGKKRDTDALSAELYDPGKILIDAGPLAMTGAELAAVLRDTWKMETEMTQGTHVLAMTGLCDEAQALDRLAAALINIDNAAADPAKTGAPGGEIRESRKSDADTENACGADIPLTVRSPRDWPRPSSVCSISEAREQESELVPIDEAVGRICAGYYYFYPPGIPFLAPGEIVTSRILQMFRAAEQAGDPVYRGGSGKGILCVRE
jgi:arginine/lysine/ornithine decarboxylase